MSNSVFGLRLGDSEHEFLEKAADGTDGILSKAGVVRVLIRQAMDSQWEPLTSQNSVPTVRANRVGAGNTNGVALELPYQFPPDLEVTNPPAPATAVPAVKGKSSKHFTLDSSFSKIEDLIREFFRVKKGAKNETAWKLLMTELTKIREKYGDDVVAEQLPLAINGKWQSITLRKYEEYGRPKPKPAWQKEPEMKHPAHRDFTAERIAAEQEGNENFLGF